MILNISVCSFPFKKIDTLELVVEAEITVDEEASERQKDWSIQLQVSFFEMLLGKFNFFPHSKVKQIFESQNISFTECLCYSELCALLLLDPLEHQGVHMYFVLGIIISRDSSGIDCKISFLSG